MTSEVAKRLDEVCPLNYIDDYDTEDDLFNDVKIALLILGYSSPTLVKTVSDVLPKVKDNPLLCDFAYRIWRLENE